MGAKATSCRRFCIQGQYYTSSLWWSKPSTFFYELLSKPVWNVSFQQLQGEKLTVIRAQHSRPDVKHETSNTKEPDFLVPPLKEL